MTTLPRPLPKPDGEIAGLFDEARRRIFGYRIERDREGASLQHMAAARRQALDAIDRLADELRARVLRADAALVTSDAVRDLLAAALTGAEGR
jgi:hypothetical protein